MLLTICTLLLSILVSLVENYAQLRYTCLTPDPTVLDYCSMDLTGPGLPKPPSARTSATVSIAGPAF